MTRVRIRLLEDLQGEIADFDTTSYAAFVLDPDGNNLEAVNVKK